MKVAANWIVMAAVFVGAASAASAQEDAGIVQPGDQRSRAEIEGLFDEDQGGEIDPGQLIAEGWASYSQGIEARAEADAAEEKKRKKLERRAERAFGESERKFLEALQQDRELVDAYIGLARTWGAAGEGERSLQAWNEAYQRTPQREEVLVGLGGALIDLERTREAASIYPKLEEHAPDAAAEYLERLREYGAGRAESGDEEAVQLLAWIEEQE